MPAAARRTWWATRAGSGEMPRVVLVVAHPDDETVGAGGRLTRAHVAAVVHVTDGSPASLHDARAAGFATRADYARARRAELVAAMALAGIEAAALRALGLGDQEAGRALAPLTRQLVELFVALEPDVVVTHPYEGGHPDHDATAFAVHHACALLRRDRRVAPEIAEMAFYHLWQGEWRRGRFHPRGRAGRAVALGPADRARKRRMLDCFRTQARVLAPFGVELERDRRAPEYDFTQPPHAGGLLYELYPWGMTGEEFRRLAAEARRNLGFFASAISRS